MTTTWCPDLSGDTAATLVGDAHDLFIERGTTTYQWAVDQLGKLATIELDPTDFNVSFNYADPQATFTRPTRPVLDSTKLEFDDSNTSLASAPVYDGTAVQLDEAPDIDSVAVPTLTWSVKPSAPTIAVPTAPSNAAELAIPVAPDYVLPDVPTLRTLDLPDLPSVDLPSWALEAPEFTDPDFTEKWSFQYEAYTETLVTTLTETMRPMIVGSTAIPEKIERLLFDRGRTKIEVEAGRALDQVLADTGNLGFDIPQGVTFDRALQVRQTSQNAIAELSREQDIAHYEKIYEQQRFAITQGAALEGTLIELHNQRQRFMLEAAQFQRDSAVALLNVRVQIQGMHLQQYQVEAGVFRDRIQAELAKIEVYRAQLEAQRAIADLNQQDVQLYLAQLQGVNAMADFYRTQVDTVRVQADIQMQAITKYRAQIDAYSSRWQAFQSEMSGYTAGLQGEATKVDLYRAMIDANAKRVDVWATSSNIAMEQKKLDMQQFGMSLDVWKAGVQRMESLLGVERARLAAVATSYDAQARIYTASADVESAASAASDRSFQLGLASEQARVDTQLKVADMKVSDTHFLAQQMVEIQKAIAQVASQLASSTMSAVGYSASVSSSRSKGNSCSTNFSFTGDTADA